MREMARMGYSCTMVTSDSNHLVSSPRFSGNQMIREIDGVTAVWLRTTKYRSAKSATRILSWIDFERKLLGMSTRGLPRPNVLIVSSLSLLTVLSGLLLKLRFRCKLVFEVRDIWPLSIVEEGGFSRFNPFVLLLAAIEWIGYRFADEIVGTMPNLSDHVRNVLGVRKRTWCIPMGVDEESQREPMEVGDSFRRDFLEGKHLTVAHVGTIGITNALEVFFEAARLMKAETRVRFLLVGSGDLKEAFREKYGHLPNVVFAPRVEKRQVAAVLAAVDVLFFSAFPSRVWRYGQSLNKAVDYMLAGKPIIASYSGYQSMINEASCGVFVPAGDPLALSRAIAEYASLSDQARGEIGRNGRRWILENRRYSRLAADYLRVMFRENPA